MKSVLDIIAGVLADNGLVTAFAFVGVTVWVSYWLSARLTRGRIHGSAIAILVGLILAGVGGAATGGKNGLADIQVLAGVGFLGGAMLRDFAIIATAFGASFDVLRSAGIAAMISLLVGVLGSFLA